MPTQEDGTAPEAHADTACVLVEMVARLWASTGAAPDDASVKALMAMVLGGFSGGRIGDEVDGLFERYKSARGGQLLLKGPPDSLEREDSPCAGAPVQQSAPTDAPAGVELGQGIQAIGEAGTRAAAASPGADDSGPGGLAAAAAGKVVTGAGAAADSSGEGGLPADAADMAATVAGAAAVDSGQGDLGAGAVETVPPPQSPDENELVEPDAPQAVLGKKATPRARRGQQLLASCVLEPAVAK